MATNRFGGGSAFRNANQSGGGGGQRYDARERMGLDGSGGSGRSGGPGVSNSFMDAYNQIRKYQGGDDGGREIKADYDGRKRGGIADQFFAGMGRIGDEIQSWSGQEEAQKDPEFNMDDVTSFLGGLVTGTISAPFTGAAQLWEAGTGHRVTEMDDQGYMPAQDLDLGQRVATGVSGGINVIGPKFGGSGEMLKTGMRAGKAAIGAAGAASGKDWGRRMLSSAVNQAKKEAPEGFAGAAWNLAKDAAEEGVEEFVQSPLDEIREGTFDEGWVGRATTAAGLGALGGGIMSGGSMAANYGLSKISGPSGTNSASSPTVQKPESPDTQTTREQMGFNSKHDTMLPDAVESMEQRMRDAAKQPGASSVLQISYDDSLGVDDADITVGMLNAMFYANDQGKSAKMVSDWLGTDINTLHSIFQGSDVANQLNALLDAKSAAGGNRKIIAGRNPDTKNGLYDVNVRKIIDGDGIALSNAGASYVKADFDGDMTQAYLSNTGVRSKGYITDNLEAPDAPTTQQYDDNGKKVSYIGRGKSNVSWDEIAFLPRSLDRKNGYGRKDVRRIFQEVFDRILGQGAVDARSYADRWIKEGMKSNNDGTAWFFTDLKNQVNEMIANGTVQGDARAGNMIISDLIPALATDPNASLARAIDLEKSKVDVAVKKLKDTIEIIMATTSDDQTGRGYRSQGSLGLSTSFAETITAINTAIAKVTDMKNNVIFRQHGRFMYEATSVFLSDMDKAYNTVLNMSRAMSESRYENVFRMLIEVSAKQADASTQSVNNVSTVFSKLTASRTLEEYSKSHNGEVASTEADFEELFRIFKKHYNELRVAYEKAMRDSTTSTDASEEGGGDMPFEASPPPEIKGDGMEADVVRAFKSVFGDRLLETYMKVPDYMRGSTLNEITEQVIATGDTVMNQFGAQDPVNRKLLEMCVTDQYNRNLGLQSDVEEGLKAIADVLNQIYAEYQVTHTLTENQKVVMTSAITAIRRYMDPKIADKVGLTSIDGFFDSRWGRMLSSRDTAANAFLEMQVAGKYDDVYRYLIAARAEKDDKRAAVYIAWAHYYLSELEHVSLLDDSLIEQLYMNSKDVETLRSVESFSKLYDAIMNNDISYEQKKSSWDSDMSTRYSSLLTDAMKTGANSFFSSEMSTRMSDSRRALADAKRMNDSENLKIWDGVFTSLSNEKMGGSAEIAITDILSDRVYDYENDVIGAAVYACTTIANVMKEKGLTPNASQVMYMIAEYNLNGGLQSFSDKVFGRMLGRMSIDDFRSNGVLIARMLIDPNLKVTVYDPVKRKQGVMSRDRILNEAGVENHDRMTLSAYNAVFRKFPSLITLVSPQSLSTSVGTDGSPSVQPSQQVSVEKAILGKIHEMRSLQANKREYDRYRAEKVVRGVLLNDTDFVADVVSCFDDITGETSMKAINRKASTIVNDIVAYVMHRARSVVGQNYEKESLALRNDMANHSARSLKTAMDVSLSYTELVGEVVGMRNEALNSILKATKDSAISNAIAEVLVDRNTGEMSPAAGQIYLKSIRGVDAPDPSRLADRTAQLTSDANMIAAMMFKGFDDFEVSDIYEQDISEAVVDAHDVIDSLSNDDVLGRDRNQGESEADYDNAADAERTRLKGLITEDSIRSVINMWNTVPVGGILDPANSGTTILYKDDFYRLTTDQIMEKIEFLNENENFGRKDLAEVRKAVRGIQRGLLHPNRRAVNIKKMNELRRFWNNLAVQRFVNKVNTRRGSMINPNIEDATYRYVSSIERMIDDSRSALKEAGIDTELVVTDIEGRVPTVPKPNLTNSTVEYMAQVARVNSTRGPAALTVGLNGANTKKYAPFALLDKEYRAPVQPVTLTKDQLVMRVTSDPSFGGQSPRYFNRFIGAMVVDGTWTPDPSPNGWMWQMHPLTLDEYNDFLNDPDPNKTITLFDPDDSPNGVDINCTNGSFSVNGCDFLQTIAQIGRLLDGSQEAMALQTAKTVGTQHYIADKTSVRTNLLPENNAVDLTRVAPSNLRAALKEAMVKYRYEYRNFLVEIFNTDRASVLDLGEIEAYNFSKLVTPYMEVDLSDGRTIIVNTIEIFSYSPTGFDNKIAEATKDGATPVAARPVALSLDEIAGKIAGDVADYVNSGNTAMRTSRDVPNRSVSHWDGYTDSLTATEILGGFAPERVARPSRLIGDDNPTVLSKFISEVYDDATPNRSSIGTRFFARSRGANADDGEWLAKARHVSRNRNSRPGIVSHGGKLGPSSGSYAIDGLPLIIKSFNSSDPGDPHTFNTARLFRDLESTPDDVNSSQSDTAGIVFQKDDLVSALGWSVMYAQPLYVSEDVAGSSNILSSYDLYIHDAITINGQRFYLYRPYDSAVVKSFVSNRMQSAVWDVSPDEVAIVASDYIKTTPGDAAIRVNRNTLGKKGFHQPLTMQVNKNSLFESPHGAVSLATLDDINSLASKSDAEIMSMMEFGSRFDQHTRNRMDVGSEIRIGLNQMINDKTPVLRSGGRNKVIAFAKTNTADGKGVKFSPIILTSGTSRTIDNIRISEDDNFNVSFDNISTLERAGDELSAQKLSIRNRSNKGIAVAVDESDMLESILEFKDDAGNNVIITSDAIINPYTDEGRNAGVWMQNMLSNMFNMMCGKTGGSLLIQLDPKTGRFRWSDWLMDPRSGFSEGDRIDLEAGEIDAWMAIANGEKTLLDPNISGNTEINDYIANLVMLNFLNGIPNNYMFSSWTKESIGKDRPVLRGKMFNFSMTMRGNDRDLVLKLFNKMNPQLCPPGIGTETDTPSTIFNEKGQMYFKVGMSSDGSIVVVPLDVAVGPVDALMHSTDLDRNTGTASYSLQHVFRQGLERELTTDEMKTLMRATMINIGNEDAYDAITGDNLKTKAPVTEFDLSGRDVGAYVDDVRKLNRVPGLTYKEWLASKSIIDAGETLQHDLPVKLSGSHMLYDDPTTMRLDEGTERGALIRDAIDIFENVRSAFGETVVDPSVSGSRSGERLSWRMFMNLIKRDSGITYNDGNGSYEITLEQMRASANRIIRSVRETGLPVSVDKTANRLESRIAVPYLSPDEMAYFWRFSGIRNNQNNSAGFAAWKDKMRAESKAAVDMIANIETHAGSKARRARARRKQLALYRFVDWCHYSNGESLPSGRIYGTEYTSDMKRNGNNFWSKVYGRKEDAKTREMMIEMDDVVAQKLAAYEEMRQLKYTVVTMEGSGRTIVSIKSSDHEIIEKILDHATRISQLMGVLSPSVAYSNYIDKGLHTGMTMIALKIGREAKIGAYATDVELNQQAVEAFSTNDMVRKMWNALRESAIDGDEGAFLATVKDEETLDAWISARKQSGTRFTRATDALFRGVNGGNAFTNWQLSNFVNYFFLLEKEAGHDWWFETDENGEMRANQVLADPNSFRFLIDVMTGRMSPSMQNAIIAQNFALQGDQAQRSLPSVFYQWLIRKYGSTAKFLTSTTMSRFVQYRINQTGRILQWVMPISSLNYVFTNMVADTEWGRANQVQDAQVFTNLRRAAINDAVHLAPQMIALVLAAIPGAIQPPEDEDKWGNPQEWLFFGQRVYPDWELQDALGLALPIAAFWKSAELGNPRLDIITNGISSACSGNPVSRMVDVVEIFGDPENSIMSDYQQDVDTYADAPGGAPDMSTWLLGKFRAAALSYAGQFVTPTFVREFFSDDMEHSYNYVYETDESGALTEEGLYGRVEQTDYMDAQIRKVSRNNPVMGWVLNWINNPSTGYMESEMPLTRVPDSQQLDSMKYWSIYDENGEPLPYEVQEEKIAEILTVLTSNDDMEALYASGFILDYDTMYATGDTIWDIVTSLDDQFYDMKKNGELDYMYLGNGDYNLGIRRATEITDAYYDERAYWKSVYYDKLMSEPMRRGLAMYNRYKTSYAVDDNGEVYATGYRTGQGSLASLSPVIVAPDSVDRTMETMGYSNDFMTPSAVTGESTGQRALIPAEQDLSPFIDFEAHAASGDGTGYSKRWDGGDSGSEDDDDDDSYPTGWGYPSYGYRRYGGGGGGGGGGGYSPNLYSRLPNVYQPSARSMYSERIYNPEYSYLRPNFETKGSREAYKRSDI